MKKGRSLVRKIYLEKTIQKIESKISLLGIYCKYNVTSLLNYRLLFSVLIFLVSYFSFKKSFLYAPILTITFYFGFEYFVLDIPIQKRAKKLEKEAIFFFEVLSLTLESGKNLKSALELTTSNIDSELSTEFKKSLNEMKMGHSFTECITNMKERIPSESINTILLNITESSTFGNSILESLNNQLDYLKEKRMLDIKAEISKLPTKLSIVSVLFFLPIMLLVVLAPVILNYLFG